MTDERGKNTEELEEVELVVDLGEAEAEAAREAARRSSQEEDETDAEGSGERSTAEQEEIRLNREQTLQDLRELQDLTVERASGRTSD